MGASFVYLEKPDTEKHTFEGKNEKLEYGGCEMQGWRLNMEDAVITNLKFDKDDQQLFAVFDGHGGKEASRVVADNFEKILKENENYANEDYEKCLTESFIKTDEFLESEEGNNEMKKVAQANPEAKNPLMKLLTGGEETKSPTDFGGEKLADTKGCTANVVFIKGNEIYCANAGDSRCVIASEGRAENLSEDHKPENEIERARIQKAGSEIVDGRVDGNLNLSRSLGDLKHKQKPGLTVHEQPITCIPDIKRRTIKPTDDFMVMACDGIWEVKSSQDIVDFIYERLKKDMKLTKIVEELFDSLISPNYEETQGLGCDNMSCIIVKFV